MKKVKTNKKQMAAFFKALDSGDDAALEKLLEGAQAEPAPAESLDVLGTLAAGLLAQLDGVLSHAEKEHAKMYGEQAEKPCCGSCQEGGVCASMQKSHFEGYEHLENVLLDALEQAAIGKGKDRHAKDGVAFEDQPMATINKAIGSIDGYIYQAHKKSLEALRLPNERARAELLGAINYLAGAVIALDTWAKK